MSEFKIKVGVELDADDLKSKLKGLDGDYKIEVQLDMSKVNSQLKELKNSFKNAFKLDTSTLGDISKVANALENLTKTTKSTGKNSGINSLVNDYKELANMASKLEKQLNSGKLGNDSIDRITASIISLKTQMGLIKNEAKQLGDSLSLSKIDAIDTSQFNKAMMDMHSYMSKIDSQADKIKKTISNIDMSNLGDGSKAELNDILDTIEKIKNEAKDVRLDFDVSGSINQLNDCYDAVKRIQNEVKEVGRSSSVGSSGLSGMFGTWDDFKSNFAQFTLAEMTGDLLADGIRRSFGFIKDTIVETDAAMTDLMKVAPESFSGTGKQLESYMTKVAEVAKGTGQTIVQTIQSNANALQVGFKDMDEAMKYAEKTSILANVGGLSIDDASSKVNGILAAYGGITNGLRDVSNEVKGATKGYTQMDNVLDQLNYSGNNFAVTTADIANVLSHSGSSLAAMGVGMEEAIGMG